MCNIANYDPDLSRNKNWHKIVELCTGFKMRNDYTLSEAK